MDIHGVNGLTLAFSQTEEQTMRKCTNCRYHIKEEHGYSNWTVEGTIVDCLLGLNPGLPEDNFWGEEKALEFANQCLNFSVGDGVELDVDREGLPSWDAPLSAAYTDDPEIKILLDKWEAKQMRV